jgi:ribosomal protein L40E
MPFFDNIGKKITETTQNVVRGTKDLTDTARFNSLIAEEERQIAELYSQVGKLYYETSEPDSETPIGKLCLSITAAMERIAKYQESIRQVKGVKRCQSCNADIPVTSAFCGVCGTKIENVSAEAFLPTTETKFCTECGAELEDELAFCTSCGQKIESLEVEK